MKSLLNILVVCTLTLASHAAAQTILSDDFNRPDGPVGNGWSTWWDGTFEHPNTKLINGELHTLGAPNQAGGIFRSLPTTFPLVISFHFRTLNKVDDFDPGLPYNDGGWLIAFNEASVLSPPPYPPHSTGAQVFFQQHAGSRNISRLYLTKSGMVGDLAPDLPEPIPGQRDYRDTVAAHIEAVINADLSATFRIHYNDGQTPDPVIISFGPASNPTNTLLPGSLFVLGNSNRSSGPHFFDNLELQTPVMCDGRAATLFGTEGNDVLIGTSAGDVIAGLSGNDGIRGLGGNDLICGGLGADVIEGGGGRDIIFGQAGADLLDGGPGADQLIGDKGNDTLLGKSGPDELYGGTGDDTMDGGTESDFCVGASHVTGDTAVNCEAVQGVP